ncbi:hypothetical protein KAI60_03095 [Candidatus Bathyarchaeota archaeon]|nr:hypothetical protein [Candidatus Bathyarchaeota archaeon]
MGKSELIKRLLNLCPICKEDVKWNISGFITKDVMRCPACQAEWKFRWITKDVLYMGLKEVGSSDFAKKYDLNILLIGDKIWEESKYQLSNFWLTYKANKEADEKRILELDKEEITKYLAAYVGGDTNLFKPFVLRQVGTLRVTKENIAFVGSIGKGAPSYVNAVQRPLVEIPLKNIDLTNFRLTSPLTETSSSITDSDPFLIIPYVDTKGIHQQPLFQLERILYNDKSRIKLNQFYKMLNLAILETRREEKKKRILKK